MKKIRLTESQLHNVILNTAKRLIKEVKEPSFYEDNENPNGLIQQVPDGLDINDRRSDKEKEDDEAYENNIISNWDRIGEDIEWGLKTIRNIDKEKSYNVCSEVVEELWSYEVDHNEVINYAQDRRKIWDTIRDRAMMYFRGCNDEEFETACFKILHCLEPALTKWNVTAKGDSNTSFGEGDCY